jgi:hypothetical protein
MILSNDKDFLQLQMNSNVEQYSPILKKKISVDDAKNYLMEMIIRGDVSDGIPNVLSDDDIFLVDGKKQNSITKKRLQQLLTMNEEEIKENYNLSRNFNRNRNLIDFEYIPTKIKTDILNKYSETKPASKQSFLNYMIKNKLSNLMEVFDDF